MNLKIGQKVKTTKRCDPDGEIVTITEIGNIGYINTTCINSASWHCLASGEYEAVEPVSEETIKFKVGDRVKVVANKRGHKFAIGQIIIVETVYPDGEVDRCKSLDGKTHWYLGNDEVEVVVEKKEPSMPKGVQVGDKFRVIKAYENFNVGDIVTFTCPIGAICSCDDNGDINNMYCHFKNSLGIMQPMNFQSEGDYPDEVEPYLEASPTKPEPESETRWVDVSEFWRDRWVNSPNRFIFGNERYLANWDDSSQEKSEEESEVRNTMALTKGEKYVPKEGASCGTYHSFSPGAKYLIITDTSCPRYDIYNEDGEKINDCSGCFSAEDLEPYTSRHKKSLMSKLSTMARKLVDADVRTFVEEGILDSELSITEEGKNFVLTQVLNANKKEYAAELKKNKAEEEETKKSK